LPRKPHSSFICFGGSLVEQNTELCQYITNQTNLKFSKISWNVVGTKSTCFRFSSLRGFIFSGGDFSLVFLVVVYLRLTFCGRILSRPLASECFSFTKEQATGAHHTTTFDRAFSVVFDVRLKCDWHGNLQSSLDIIFKSRQSGGFYENIICRFYIITGRVLFSLNVWFIWRTEPIEANSQMQQLRSTILRAQRVLCCNLKLLPRPFNSVFDMNQLKSLDGLFKMSFLFLNLSAIFLSSRSLYCSLSVDNFGAKIIILPRNSVLFSSTLAYCNSRWKKNLLLVLFL